MKNNINQKKIISIILCIVGIIIVIDTSLEQFLNIGTKQTSLILGYCIAFLFSGIKFPDILKRKYVIYPLYLMLAQMLYSLVAKYF